MKTRIICTLAVLLLFSQFAFSQNGATDTNRRNANKTIDYRTGAFFYPFAALKDNFKLALEHRPSEQVGIRAIFLYGYGENNEIFYPNIDEYSSFGGEFQLRYYPINTNPGLFTGLYASGRVINTMRVEYDLTAMPVQRVEREYDASLFGFGVLAGLQGVIARRFILDTYLAVGPGMPSGKYKLDVVLYDPWGQPYNEERRETIIPGLRKGMQFTFGLNGGVVLFK